MPEDSRILYHEKIHAELGKFSVFLKSFQRLIGFFK